MLFLSRAKISVDAHGRVRVEGLLEEYAARVADFIADLGLRNATVRFRNGRYVFSRGIDEATQQRLRNFLVNRCPLRNLDA